MANLTLDQPYKITVFPGLAAHALAALWSRLGGDKTLQIVDAEDIDNADWALPPGVRLGVVLDMMLARQVALAGPRRFQNVDQKIILDLTTRTVTCGTAPAVRLTEREADLLTALAYAPDQTLTKQLILQDVWRYVPGLETHTLETHIYRLRQKIEADPKSPNVLITVENGYRLNVRVHP